MSLDGRKRQILLAIVNEYVETADPIGSEWLATRHDFGCKSATLRNEMAEMSELGYLLQPHTSAGRIPSDRGYRFYVDRLMPAPSPPSVSEPWALPAGDTATGDVEEMVKEACRLLAGMTKYISVATPPAPSVRRLTRVFLTHATSTQLLLVLLLSTGDVLHRMIDAGAPPSDSDLVRVANLLSEKVGGQEMDAIARSQPPTPTGDLASLSPFVQRVFSAIQDAARSLAEGKLFLEGASQILRHREFQDVARLEQVLSALEQRSVLYEVFSRAVLGQDVSVIIGTEAPVGAMRDCSVVTSPYCIGDRVGGFIGVVGPTRMRYESAVGAVGFMARNLSALLTSHTLG